MKCEWPRLLFLCWLTLAAPANAQTAAPGSRGTVPESSPEATVERLAGFSAAIDKKRASIESIRAEISATDDDADREQLEAELQQAREELANLRKAFEQVVTGRADDTVFVDEPVELIDWRRELEQISMPILATLKDLTDKPRKIEKLRGQIELLEEQQQVLERAMSSLESYGDIDLPEDVDELHEDILEKWLKRQGDTAQELELAQFQLDSLLGENTRWVDMLREASREFAKGRGLTLLLAAGIGFLTWLITKLLMEIYRRAAASRHDREHTTRVRLALYGYRLITTLLVLVAVMAVFYVRGDLLLLALTLLALVSLILGLRQALPRYVAEMKLLIGVGPVRQAERLVVNGLPMRVSSINVYSILRNPDLEGFIRLPLNELGVLVSRPAGNEPWFPCKPQEYVLLGDGTFAQVLRQTLERVELRVVNSIVHVPTTDFLSQNIRNLSREGFGVPMVFGIDYAHQAICLEEVAGKFEQAIRDQLEQSGFGDQLVSLMVDFKEAAASSLDYQIYAVMDGAAASSYHLIRRLVQQACVALCNRQGWVIPFSQLTVHQGEGFDALRHRELQVPHGA